MVLDALRGVRVVWQYGLWTAISSLIKVPERELTFVLGNTDALSAPTRWAPAGSRRQPGARVSGRVRDWLGPAAGALSEPRFGTNDTSRDGLVIDAISSQLGGIPREGVIALLALLSLQVIVQLFACIDLARRRTVRGGSKWVWVLVILAGSPRGGALPRLWPHPGPGGTRSGQHP